MKEWKRKWTLVHYYASYTGYKFWVSRLHGGPEFWGHLGVHEFSEATWGLGFGLRLSLNFSCLAVLSIQIGRPKSPKAYK